MILRVRLRHTWTIIFSWSLLLLVNGQCPWSRELVDLHTDCVCAYSNSQRLSIQCSPVNFTKLMDTLRSSVKNIPIDLLYINNSTAEILRNDTFADLRIQSLHISRSKVREVEQRAFVGLEDTLTSLNLQDNLLREVPTSSIKNLTFMQLLDLSHNHIQDVPDDSFKGLPLTTLKLSDNQHVNILDGAFQGLEGTLKNLNLQASELVEMPKAIQRLKALAFLDLAQNKIIRLEPGFLSEMQSLTALNMERNRISELDQKAFLGVNATLSSLSLLNNALEIYPIDAISSLTEIRVMDLGFNGISSLPIEAFQKNKYLTLLALDGNPLQTIPIEAFLHLNATLRGLSLGGSALVCDCRIRWVSEWMQDRGLQITSRERNPQFCGQPEHLRRRNFLQLQSVDFICDNDSLLNYTSPRPPSGRGTKGPKRLSADYAERTGGASNVLKSDDTKLQGTTVDNPNDIAESVSSGGKGTEYPSDDIFVGSGTSRVSRKKDSDIRIKHAFKRDSTLVVEWDSKEQVTRGFQVLIRVFGSRDFKRILPIARDRRRIHIENLPLSQCLVVCVIDYEEISSIKIENIPHRQCRELKGDESRIVSLDKMVICAAVICIVVIIGASVIIIFYLRRKEPGDPISTSSPMPGTIPIMKPETEWETLSWNSGRSTPKTPHCLTNGGNFKSGSTSRSFVLTDGQLQHKLPPPYPKMIANGFSKAYSTHDNESRLSYSHVSKLSNGGIVVSTIDGGTDVQRSKSLTRPAGYHPYGGNNNIVRKKKHRGNGRQASASSAQSSTECESDWNGRSIWKDNDVDIYISKNHMMNGNKKHRKDYSIR